MPRPKKQHLKQRKDGRFCCVYHGKQFMGNTEEEALARYQTMIHHEDDADTNTTVLYNDSTIQALYDKVLAYVTEKGIGE
jgi:hypothetical protein